MADKDKIKAEYEKLSKKHDLPDFSTLDKYFKISKIKDENDLLTKIAGRIQKKVEFFLGVIKPILEPEQIVIEMHESNYFSDIEKEELTKLLKDIMYLQCYGIQLKVENGNEESAEFIRNAAKSWPELKEKVLNVAKKLKDSWKDDVNIEEMSYYTG